MKTYCTITFPGAGRVYQIPTALIYEDRVRARLSLGLAETEVAVRAEILEDFSNDFTLVDWAKNNMDWREIEPHAVLVQVFPRKLASEWDDASVEPTDEQKKPEEIGLENAMDAPLQAFLTAMVANGEECAVIGINSDQPVGAAMIVVQGPAEVVQGYVATVAQFNDFLQKQRAIVAGQGADAITH